jgi:phosphoribosylaminoimidazolecarboxamide formyltransferase/IMP cyclohydrolase
MLKRLLKYGLNPNQQAFLSTKNNAFCILNGNPGYINILDAIFSFQLVSEMRKYNNSYICSASFKHNSPAGVAIGTTPLESYKKARNCDPKSSFGDFIAINTIVDTHLAKYIKTCIADGIIAPGFTQEAFEILKAKKGGNFLIFQGDCHEILNNTEEIRTISDITLSQTPHRHDIDSNLIKHLTSEIQQDIILSMVVAKYTQSNSVCFVYDGQAIGIGAGQQSRVDCVLLARQKAEIWFLRQNVNLEFKENIKNQDKINATIDYLQYDFSPVEYKRWEKLFVNVPNQLTNSEKNRIYQQYQNIVLSSDGFFPFRDSIDKASKLNVKYVIQPGGSIGDESVKMAVQEYNMEMINTGIRLFLH